MSNTTRHIGPYRVIGKLDEGGNAKVYRAVRKDKPEEIALKVRQGRPSTEPHRRFKQEIETLLAVGPFPGVLPVLEAHIPDPPSTEDPVWLAMPIAEPISDRLENADLEAVVGAVAEIADTLARLQEEHGIGHRDIKPQNLYGLGDEWLIGDFGLVDLPDGEELTVAGKPIGSRHYTPWELISDPMGADSHPADVYALGKTLWVLATGQTFPPEGPQPAGARGLSIDEFRPHPHALQLDRLIERMTLREPEARPSKREVADELQAWLDLPAPIEGRDVSAVRAKLREKLAAEMSVTELRERYREAHVEAWKKLEARFDAVINQMLRDVHPRPALNDIHDKLTQNTTRTLEAYGKDYLKQLYRCSSISAGDQHNLYSLRVGRGAEVFEDGELKIHAFVDVGCPDVGGSDFHWTMEPVSVPVESIEVERVVEETVAAVEEKLAEALEIFAEKAPSPS